MKIRAAILGYGRSGSTMHAGALEKNSDSFEVVAACDVDPVRRQQAAERFKCRTYADHGEMLAREKLDLVSVVTRSDQHCAMACDCLSAGVHVLVTKPWAVDAGEARRMVAAAEKSGRTLMPWLPARWGTDLRRLRQLVSEGAIGNVFLIRRVVCSFGTRADWQTERRYGGGYVLNWGPHIVDPPVLLAGSPVKSVYARLKRVINPGDAEDMFFAILNLADGTVVQAEYTVSMEDLPEWFLQGTHGTIVVRGRNVTVRRGAPPHPTDPTQYAGMRTEDAKPREEVLGPAQYGDEVEIYGEIAAALRGERPFPVTPAHALELSRVLDAIRTASDEDRVVNL